MMCRSHRLGLSVLVGFALAGAPLQPACSSGEPSGGSGRGPRPAPNGGSSPGATAGSSGSSVIPGGQAPRTMMPTIGSTAPPQEVPDGGGCASISHMAEVMLGPVDIVWIIDGSGSMLDETAAVQNNITNFANMISGAGIDHHVIMLAGADVAGPTPLGMDRAHYLWVPAIVDSHNALQVLLDLYPQYSTFLRPEAALHFVVVTDDESFLAATQFQMQMEGLLGKKFIFHAIASESVNGAPCVGACGLPLICGGFAPGVQYYQLADATGGHKISICIADWSMVFGPLQEAVIESAPLPCNYPLPQPPMGETLDANKVNLEYTAPDAAGPEVFPRAASEAECAQSLAWFYDNPDAPTEIRMCPSACTAISGGGSVDIALGCETVQLVPE